MAIKHQRKGTAAHPTVSLGGIDRRLKRIETMLSKAIPQLKVEEDKLLEETASIEKEEKLIESKEAELENTEAALLRQLGEQVQRKFSDIVDWKTFVWDRCTFRKSKEEAKTIDYFCTKLNGLCRFESCPMNH